MAAFDITDAEKCFREMKRRLKALDSEELRFDDRFLMAFGVVFKVPNNIVKEMKEHLKKKLDPDSSGTVDELEWASFHSDWQLSNESMIDYLNSLMREVQQTTECRRDEQTPTIQNTDTIKMKDMSQSVVSSSTTNSGDNVIIDAIDIEGEDVKDVIQVHGGAKSIREGLFDGLRFEVKLTFPVEFALRLITNIIVRYSEQQGYDTVVNQLKEDTAKILEGINALRVAKLKTAQDQLEALYGQIQLILDSSNISSKDLEKKAGRLQNDAATVLNFANEAFNTVKNVNEQIAAVRIAMCAIPVKYIDENDPRHVSKALEDQIKKLLKVKAIKRAIDTQDAGGGGLLGNRESREKLICDVLRLVHAEEAYVYSKGISRKSPPLPQSERFLFNTNDRSFLRTIDRNDLCRSWASSCACACELITLLFCFSFECCSVKQNKTPVQVSCLRLKTCLLFKASLSLRKLISLVAMNISLVRKATILFK